jgi:hypothetical protein
MPKEMVPKGDDSRRNATVFGPVVPLSSPKQAEALTLLVAGRSPTAAAQAVGVDRATVYRWMKYDAAFIASYNAAVRELDEVRRQGLRLLAGESIQVVRRMMKSRKTPPAIRARLALEVIRLAEGTPEPGTDDPEEAKGQVVKALRRHTGIGGLDARAYESAVADLLGRGPKR